MSTPSGSAGSSPRMFVWLVLTLGLFCSALLVQRGWPSSLLAVSLYKAHLMALAGWGGYWLDRALFPYDRPHEYLEMDSPPEVVAEGVAAAELVASGSFGMAMLRRAIIVAGCLVCVAMGA